MERSNERKRRNHRLQSSELEKDKTITPPNSFEMGYDYYFLTTPKGMLGSFNCQISQRIGGGYYR